MIDNTATTLYPGGILNTGFALSWAKDRVHDAKPASPTGGQPWALKRIQGGDEMCKANQVLHAQARRPDRRRSAANHYYVPKVADPLAPVTFVHKIHVPVFLACQFTDEQTGGHCPALASRFTGTAHKWFTFTNGMHIDSLDPATFNRWYDFLSLYVAQPGAGDPGRGAARAAPTMFSARHRRPGRDPARRPDPARSRATTPRWPRSRRCRPCGSCSTTAPAPRRARPVAGFEQSFAALPAARDTALYLARQLGRSGRGGDAFTWTGARPATDFSGDNTGAGGLWTRDAAPTTGRSPRPARRCRYTTPPLTPDTVVVGAGALTAWIKASERRRRPAGHGLRGAAGRQGDVRAERLAAPAQARRRERRWPVRAPSDAAAAHGQVRHGHDPALLRGPRLPGGLAHPGDASAPGGDQPMWSFAETGRTAATVADRTPSAARLACRSSPGVAVPTPLPPCPGLRGEPCRVGT